MLDEVGLNQTNDRIRNRTPVSKGGVIHSITTLGKPSKAAFINKAGLIEKY
jgi:hypothetical protein